jgi:catechol 2,3-dioxygenase-like lactoylglutathione lyase family enzyme
MMIGRPVFSQLNIVVRDMDAAIGFYRMLGLDISSPVGDWPPGSGARHVDGPPEGGAHLDLDNAEMTRIWAGQALEPGAAVIGFCVPSREAVDDTFAQLTEAGYLGRRQPYDAFFGSRYAIVEDPDGHCIGLMSPADPQLRYTPDL